MWMGGLFAGFLSLIFALYKVEINDMYLTLGYLILLTGFYYVAVSYLVDYKWFRRFFSPRKTQFEGYWAETIHDSPYTISLGRIYYDPSGDNYIYRGWAYKDFSSESEDASWKSDSFVFDRDRKKFSFVCESHERSEKELGIESVGYLEIENNHVFGIGINRGRETGLTSFSIDLYRVTPKDFKTIFNVPEKKPRNAEERLALIKEALTRTGKMPKQSQDESPLLPYS